MERIEVEDRTVESAPRCACGAPSECVVPTTDDAAAPMCWPCTELVVEAIDTAMATGADMPADELS